MRAILGAPGSARRWLPAVLLAAAAVQAWLASPGFASTTPTPTPPRVIDGPDAGLAGPVSLGLSVARDGTGGLVYLKQVAGVEHVFVSLLVGGVFGPPQEVDPGLTGSSSQPVIAAGNGGLVQIAFINSGVLYVSGRTTAAAGLSAPRGIASGASNPDLQMTNFGKAYLAFTVADGSGFDVRSAYYFGGIWALEPTPLNQLAADDAGTGKGAPSVAAAGDGVAVVAWGESGHVFTRRVWATSPSVVLEQADAALPGCAESAADEPAVAAGGDSSYAVVAFHETLTCGSATQSRVLSNRLRGSAYDGIVQADGLSTKSAGGADRPQVVMGEYGHGWVTSTRTPTNDVYAMLLNGNGAAGPIIQVNGLPNASPPYGIPATAGLFSDLIAWQQDPGSSGSPEIRLRYARSGGPNLDPDIVVSSPAQGPTNAASGLAAIGDVAGDVAVAWVQGSGASTQIVAAQLYRPPGSAAPASLGRYVRSLQPRLSWAAAAEAWGGVVYTVSVDGAVVGQTAGTALAVPSPLSQGPHTWQVSATNAAGLTSTSRAGRMFVDTLAPEVSLVITGRRRVGAPVRATVSYTDAPPPLPRGDASGIASVVIFWGDRTHSRLGHRKLHVYKRARRYKLTVVVRDRAGNATFLVRFIKIARPRHHAKHKHH